jgi:hypothetical protein
MRNREEERRKRRLRTVAALLGPPAVVLTVVLLARSLAAGDPDRVEGAAGTRRRAQANEGPRLQHGPRRAAAELAGEAPGDGPAYPEATLVVRVLDLADAPVPGVELSVDSDDDG